MKGYWIANVDVTDAQAYEGYRTANGVAFAKYGGRFLVRGGAAMVKEGSSRARQVVVEFESYQQAIDCYESPEYQAAIAKRSGASEGDVVIVEGYDGSQPE